jgi:hypothetical protein
MDYIAIIHKEPNSDFGSAFRFSRLHRGGRARNEA